MTTFGKRIVDSFKVTVYHEHIVVALSNGIIGILVVKFVCRPHRTVRVGVVVISNLHILVNDGVHVELLVGNLLVEVGYLLEPQLLYEVLHGTVFKLNLAVLHLAG